MFPVVRLRPLRAQTVKVNWQTGAPFSTYKTFAWQDPKSQTIPFYGPWVKADVIAELQNERPDAPFPPGKSRTLIVILPHARTGTVGRNFHHRWLWNGRWSLGRRVGLVRWLGRLGTMVRRFNNLHFGASQDDSHSNRSTWPMPHRTRRSFFAARRPSKTSPNPNRETKSRPSNVLRKYSRAIPPKPRK